MLPPGSPQSAPDTISWGTVVDIAVGLAVAFQSWLLKTVWDTRVSKEQVHKMIEEAQAVDDVRDAALLKLVEQRIEGLYQGQQQTRTEVRTSFEGLSNRMDRVGQRIDEFMRSAMDRKSYR